MNTQLGFLAEILFALYLAKQAETEPESPSGTISPTRKFTDTMGMRWQRWDNSISIATPAKLNLYLEVLGKRVDGFHELETVITTVDRFDELRITQSKPNGIQLSCYWHPALKHCPGVGPGMFGDLPSGADNLVFRAAEIFFSELVIKSGLTIELNKMIPSQAGLGGASGNAAGTLIALDQLFGTRLPANQLVDLAARLGSDVPFFITGGAAFCTGRGEQVAQFNIDDDLYFVVVKPPFGASTQDVFQKLKLGKEVKTFPRDNLSTKSFDWPSNLFNRLQEPMMESSREIGEVCDFLQDSGCLASLMTGSGSCCFGICNDGIQASEIANNVAEAGLGFVFTCQNLKDFSVPF
jgi:4-diphosphocytidyl-2-C-methyl-D-erythritol kinase